ncbi:hypothetical protein IM660_04705 [Ruania alkalisoli]|uniref:PIN domain-containing protein n=1 Tax=Ruania alkalisoli TaxID=2779775 RepID=A0A7M1SVI0_9MICO|nr:hypothetical protein [Ruania alkalisoli]QOR71596.1 hypothetical protein IM660_04705 [Ruania alkalisoli]
MTRKLRVSRLDAARAIESIHYPVVSTDEALVARAAHTATEHSLSIFDSLIVESAASVSARELWTEGLSTGSTIRGVAIVDPFRIHHT